MIEIIRRNKAGKWSNIAGVLAFIWMCIIFFFSAQTKEESSVVSEGFSYRIVNTTGLFFHLHIDEEQIREIARAIEGAVRKGAHMTEYAILAILLYVWMCRWQMSRLRKSLVAAVIATLYAGSDEFHQLFVAGRAGSFGDVLIDSAGAVLGLIFFHLTVYIVILLRRHRKAKRQDKL
ncbi:MAG: VanZ family protein [Lachnospiraceae bacterium]|nr:VanZ family protein [Lachnospiraceae bacterium]